MFDGEKGSAHDGAMRIFRAVAVVGLFVLAACGVAPVIQSAPANLEAQAESGACQEAARVSEGLVLQDLAEAYVHRPSDEAFAAYMDTWLGTSGVQMNEAIKACLGTEGAPVP